MRLHPRSQQARLGQSELRMAINRTVREQGLTPAEAIQAVGEWLTSEMKYAIRDERHQEGCEAYGDIACDTPGCPGNPGNPGSTECPGRLDLDDGRSLRCAYPAGHPSLKAGDGSWYDHAVDGHFWIDPATRARAGTKDR